MGTYVMLTRLSPEALKNPESVTRLNKQVEDRIEKDCPGVKWLSNYAVLGPCDISIYSSADPDTASKVVLLIRSFGHGTTETWFATPWDRFTELATALKS